MSIFVLTGLLLSREDGFFIYTHIYSLQLPVSRHGFSDGAQTGKIRPHD